MGRRSWSRSGSCGTARRCSFIPNRTPLNCATSRAPIVALNFDGNGDGGDIVVFTGLARIAADEPPADQVAPYVAKYTAGFAEIGMTAAEFAQTYSVAVRVTPTKVRGHWRS